MDHSILKSPKTRTTKNYTIKMSECQYRISVLFRPWHCMENILLWTPLHKHKGQRQRKNLLCGQFCLLLVHSSKPVSLFVWGYIGAHTDFRKTMLNHILHSLHYNSMDLVGVWVLNLPGCSPDQSPIKTFWRILKQEEEFSSHNSNKLKTCVNKTWKLSFI